MVLENKINIIQHFSLFRLIFFFFSFSCLECKYQMPNCRYKIIFSGVQFSSLLSGLGEQPKIKKWWITFSWIPVLIYFIYFFSYFLHISCGFYFFWFLTDCLVHHTISQFKKIQRAWNKKYANAISIKNPTREFEWISNVD